MATIPGTPLPFQIRGTYDAMDGMDAPDGACNILQDLIHDITTPRVWRPRAAAISATTFPGFTTPSNVTAALAVGARIYGMVSSGRFAGNDEPFIYDTATNTFITVGNVTAANTPTTQLTTGDWTPPMMDVVNGRILVTHPGFSGGNTFGWFDISAFSLTFTGDTFSNNVIGNTSVNPFTAGLQPGQLITGAGIPAGTYIVGMVSTAISLSQSATATATGVSFTATGGTFAAPLWDAGNTSGTSLPGVATDVMNFGNRAFYAVGNQLWFTDVLKPTVISQATQFLVCGDKTPVIGMGGIPIQQTTGGILAALIAFKAAGGYYQVTGDIALNNLAMNGPIGNTGCVAARSIVQTPMGLWFMGEAGIHVVDFSGLLSKAPVKGVRYPFNQCVAPTRASAAFNNTVYRISMTGPVGPAFPNTVHVEYWYDTEIDEWSGPHTCGQDIVIPVGDTFYFGSNDNPGALYQSDVDITTGTTYTEFGNPLQVQVRTTTLNRRGMSAKNVTEATIDLAQTSNFSGVTLTLYASNLRVLASTVTAVGPPPGAIWGTMVWGAFTWGPSPVFLSSYMIDWPYPVPFTYGSVGVNIQSYGGLRIGTLWLRIEDLQYANTQNPP